MITTHQSHGWKETISEVCVPELCLFINSERSFILDHKDAQARVESAEDVREIPLRRGDQELFILLYSAIRQKDELSAKIRKKFNRS